MTAIVNIATLAALLVAAYGVWRAAEHLNARPAEHDLVQWQENRRTR